ncbi:hypothetical protein M8J77_008205 [Diaphorina citri]|nr:hypothetical protein M8J77_011255 [Diaphorina citri]KAI5697874.1 hypothetical protein M8J77_008205 [Diaphorina citri]
MRSTVHVNWEVRWKRMEGNRNFSTPGVVSSATAHIVLTVALTCFTLSVLSAPDDIGTSSAAPAPRPPPSNESTTDSSTQPTRPTAAAAAVPGLDSLDLTSPLSRPGSMSPAAPQSMEAGTYSYPNLTSPLSRPGSMSPAAPSLWKQVRTPILT